MKVWKLRYNPDRTQNSERSGQYFVSNTSHHITTTRRDFIDTDREWNIALANAIELAGCQPVAVHQTTATFQAHNNFVFFGGQRQHGRDFLAQVRDGRGGYIAIKIDHKNPRLRCLNGLF